MTNDKDSAVLVALEAMLEHYVQLAGCGDCGNWNPEDEPIVISTRKLLAQHHAASDALMRIASIKADDGDDFSGWDDDVVIRCEISVADLKAVRATLRQPTQSDALREALRFYAREANYRGMTMYMSGKRGKTAIEIDGGQRARAALQEQSK